MSTEIFEGGYVYVLYNPIYAMYGELYKIGRAKNINDRLKSYTTSYPEESEIKYSIRHPYYKELEKVVHLTLKEHRMSSNREFFKCSLDLIKETIDKVKEYTLEEISNSLNKGVDVILNGYKKEEVKVDVKEPIELSRENIIKVFNQNGKELYNLFFNLELGVTAIVKIFIDKFCTNKEGKLLIECIDKTKHKYKYTDIYNKEVVITSLKICELLLCCHDIERTIRFYIGNDYSLEIIECKNRLNILNKEFKGIHTKFKHIMLEYF